MIQRLGGSFHPGNPKSRALSPTGNSKTTVDSTSECWSNSLAGSLKRSIGDSISATFRSTLSSPLAPEMKYSKADQLKWSSVISKRRPLRKIPLYIPLILVWTFLIYYVERIYPQSVVARCEWPKVQNPDESPTLFVAMVADPQIIDKHTYPGRNRLLQRISESVSDQYLRRSWVYVQRLMDPDVTFFLGDLFDGGRDWSDADWQGEFSRFNAIFQQPSLKKTIFSLPGNHDIGYGDGVIPGSLQRFEAFFGNANSVHTFANHTFVIVDTISYANSINETIYGPSQRFVEDYATGTLPKQSSEHALSQKFKVTGSADGLTVLLTHVPLSRPKGTDCGPKREAKGELPSTKGYQYQTQVTKEHSDEVLKAIQPDLVFSGDDHDACHVTHNIVGSSKKADEYTVKSMSMAMGISEPAIQLLTLSESSYGTQLCMLPSPFRGFILYGIFALLSVAFLAWYYFLSRHSVKGRFVNTEYENDGIVLPVHQKQAGAHLTSAHIMKNIKVKLALRDAIFASAFVVLFLCWLYTGMYSTSWIK